MGVKLVSASGGSVEINPPATASSFTATMPAGTGNVVVNGVNGALVSATAQASTSGTSIDFTGIPSWVRRITVMFSGVSTNGTSLVQVQIGSGSVLTTGYNAAQSFTGAAAGQNIISTGFPLIGNSASDFRYGMIFISLLTPNTYTCTGSNYASSSNFGGAISGQVALGGALDRVRITTINGTDAFDAGSINIMYE